MDLVEVPVAEEVWDLDFAAALPPGLMLVAAEVDCPDVAIFSVEPAQWW